MSEGPGQLGTGGKRGGQRLQDGPGRHEEPLGRLAPSPSRPSPDSREASGEGVSKGRAILRLAQESSVPPPPAARLSQTAPPAPLLLTVLNPYFSASGSVNLNPEDTASEL